MEDLIKALQIFSKYVKEDEGDSPTHCEHDIMYVCCGIEFEDVSAEDVKTLDKLGFFWGESDSFCSYRFGSC